MFFRHGNTTFHKANWDFTLISHWLCEISRLCFGVSMLGRTYPFPIRPERSGDIHGKKMKTRQLIRQDQWKATRRWVSESSSWLEWPFVAAPPCYKRRWGDKLQKCVWLDFLWGEGIYTTATARTLWTVYAHLPAHTSLPFPCLRVVYVFCLTSIVIMTCDYLGSTSFTAGRKGAESTTDQASLCVFVWIPSECIFMPSICMK